MRPGVTGLAQVSGRNALTWEEKFAFDVEYVERRSWRLDLSIVVRTLQVTVSRQGISADDDVTMPEFLGMIPSRRGDRDVTRRVVLVGVGGHGRECLDVLEASIAGGESIEVLGFVDDEPAEENLRRVRDLGYPYLGPTPR